MLWYTNWWKIKFGHFQRRVLTNTCDVYDYIETYMCNLKCAPIYRYGVAIAFYVFLYKIYCVWNTQYTNLLRFHAINLINDSYLRVLNNEIWKKQFEIKIWAAVCFKLYEPTNIWVWKITFLWKGKQHC